MNAYAHLLFLFEIETQTRFALRAARNLNRALREGRSESFWYAAQSFIVASANVSKLLWGTPRSSLDRRELRELLGVSDSSPLHSRLLRNHFEHFDERIERSLSATRGELNHVDQVIGDVDDVVPDELFRSFDPKRQTFLYGDETYELEPLVASLKKLHAATKLELRRRSGTKASLRRP